MIYRIVSSVCELTIIVKWFFTQSNNLLESFNVIKWMIPMTRVVWIILHFIQIYYEKRLKILNKGNQKPYIDRQTTQRPKEIEQLKWQTMIYKILGVELKIELHETHTKNRGELMCSTRVSNSCSTLDTCRVTIKRHEHHLI